MAVCLPVAAQTMSDDWQSVAKWRKTAAKAEALLDLPLVRRDHVTIDQWEDLRLDLTVQREEALILSVNRRPNGTPYQRAKGTPCQDGGTLM